MPDTRDTHGFTLIELLVVVSIIALLIAMLLPSLGRAKEESRRMQCLANVRSLTQAAATYATDNRGVYPLNASEPYDWSPWSGAPAVYPRPPYWDVRLFSYVGNNYAAYACPTMVRHFQVNYHNAKTYRINTNITGYVSGASAVTAMIGADKLRAPSRTILFNESYGVFRYNEIYGWGSREWYDVAVTHNFGSYITTTWGPRPDQGGSHFGLADGHADLEQHGDGQIYGRAANLILKPATEY